MTDVRMGDPLPSNITVEDIKAMSAKKIRKLISLYGIDSVNRRLSGEDPAEEPEDESAVSNVLVAQAILFDRDVPEEKKK
jgi:hypothetical protein